MPHWCPRCDSEDVRVVSAGANWLVECNSCHYWWHITNAELEASR